MHEWAGVREATPPCVLLHSQVGAILLRGVLSKFSERGSVCRKFCVCRKYMFIRSRAKAYTHQGTLETEVLT